MSQNQDDEFALTDLERNSPVWLRLQGHLRNRIELHRARNDSPASAEETAALRGRIAEAKAILSLGDDE